MSYSNDFRRTNHVVAKIIASGCTGALGIAVFFCAYCLLLCAIYRFVREGSKAREWFFKPLRLDYWTSIRLLSPIRYPEARPEPPV